jgi:L-threonylcarbamoyladenylate synthase
MKVLRVDPAHPEPEAIREAAAAIRSGELVAFPTETVYGLGGNALSPVAVERIFAAKGRPSFNPLIVHCRDTAEARSFAADWPAAAARLAAEFWPGPLTLVVRKDARIPDCVTAGLTTVALRVPSHPVARALLEAAEVPIAAPSANRFMEVSPTEAAHVLKGLAERAHLLLDGGPAPVGIESAVVDVSGDGAVLLRPGSISRERIEAVLGTGVSLSAVYSPDAPRPAPGMIRRHYAPRAEVVLVPAGDVDGFTAALRMGPGGGGRTGAIIRTLPLDGEGFLRLPTDPEGYSRGFYAALHTLDGEGYDRIVVEEVPADDDAWAGVRDRLGRAAARGE